MSKSPFTRSQRSLRSNCNAELCKQLAGLSLAPALKEPQDWTGTEKQSHACRNSYFRGPRGEVQAWWSQKRTAASHSARLDRLRSLRVRQRCSHRPFLYSNVSVMADLTPHTSAVRQRQSSGPPAAGGSLWDVTDITDYTLLGEHGLLPGARAPFLLPGGAMSVCPPVNNTCTGIILHPAVPRDAQVSSKHLLRQEHNPVSGNNCEAV